MRTQVFCACLALWSVPAGSLGAAEQVTPATVVSTPAAAAGTSAARHDTVRIGSVSFDRRALALVAMVCLVGTIAGLATRHPREPRVRSLAKPKRTRLTVLVPPGPAPRLIPGDSPNATRARRARAPVTRMAPAGTGSGIIDYIAPFVASESASEKARVDYLLDPGDPAQPQDPSAGNL